LPTRDQPTQNAIEQPTPFRIALVKDLDERKLDEYLALIDKKIGQCKDWSGLSDAERINDHGIPLCP